MVRFGPGNGLGSSRMVSFLSLADTKLTEELNLTELPKLIERVKEVHKSPRIRLASGTDKRAITGC
jgi:hypothetical protein